MPENSIPPANRNHSQKENSSQINEQLDNMSIDELTDALADMWDTTDDRSYSTAWMDECLEGIEQIENAPDFDADASFQCSVAALTVDERIGDAIITPPANIIADTVAFAAYFFAFLAMFLRIVLTIRSSFYIVNHSLLGLTIYLED